MGCLWDVYGTFMGCLWDVYGTFMGRLWAVYGLFMGCLWDVYGMFMGCLWDVYGLFMGRLWDVYGPFMGCLCAVYGLFKVRSLQLVSGTFNEDLGEAFLLVDAALVGGVISQGAFVDGEDALQAHVLKHVSVGYGVMGLI